MLSIGKEGFPIRNHITLPALAILAGGTGFLLRKWQWMTAYAPELERFLPGSPASYALLAVLLGAAALCLILSRSASKNVDRPLPPTCDQPLYMSVMVAAGFLFMGAGGLGLLEGMELLQLLNIGYSIIPSYPPALLLCGGLSLVAGIATLIVAKHTYRPANGWGQSGALAVIPPFAMLVWLFATHQAHATDPIFTRYGVYLTAAILLLLAHYYGASFHQGFRCTGRFLFCSLMGTVLTITALADGLSWFQMAMAAAAALSALGQTWALLSPPSPTETES